MGWEQKFESPEPAGKRILIVEDDTDILEVLVELLHSQGYSVASAANGQEGIDYLSSAPNMPDLILLDLMMPVKDGFTFYTEMKQDAKFSRIPTVFMSAGSQLGQKIANIPGLKYVKKPLDMMTLLNTIRGSFYEN